MRIKDIKLMMEGAGSRLVIADRCLVPGPSVLLLGRAHGKAIQAGGEAEF